MSTGRVVTIERRLAAYTGLCVLVGLVAGWAWRTVLRLPEYVVREGGRADLSEDGRRAIFASDAWFVLLGLPAGLLLGWIAWRALRDLGWPVTVVAAAGGLLAASTCWMSSLLLAPAPFQDRLAQARPGDAVAVDFTLRSPVAVLVWVAAAMIPLLLAATFRPDPEDAARSPRSAGDVASVGPGESHEV